MKMNELSQMEKDQLIEAILTKGLTKPKSLWAYLDEIYRALGVEYIFFDMTGTMAMSVVAMLGFIALYPLSPWQHLYATLFALAPIFFVLILLFTETAERVTGLYELKMTCRYTIQQISAFRVVCFSLMSAVFCTLISLYFTRLPGGYGFFRAGALSLCALFLCAFLTLLIMRCFRRWWIHFAAMLIWGVTGFVPAWIFGEGWERFLSQVPVGITLLTAAVTCVLFLREIKKLMNIRKSEVVAYADC